MIQKKVSNYILKVVENNGPLKVLQIAYGVIGLVFLLLAGLVSLVNQALGWGFLIVPLVTFVALGLNTVCWALIRLYIDTVAAQRLRELAAAKPRRRTGTTRGRVSAMQSATPTAAARASSVAKTKKR